MPYGTSNMINCKSVANVRYEETYSAHRVRHGNAHFKYSRV
jgi:hypothetical protein